MILVSDLARFGALFCFSARSSMRFMCDQQVRVAGIMWAFASNLEGIAGAVRSICRSGLSSAHEAVEHVGNILSMWYAAAGVYGSTSHALLFCQASRRQISLTFDVSLTFRHYKLTYCEILLPSKGLQLTIDLPPPTPLPLFEMAEDLVVRKFRKSAFLTYAHADDRYVTEVNQALKTVGVKTYIDREFLEIGRLDDQIIASLKQAEFQVIFCTEAANQSEWCKKEIDFSRSVGVKQIPIIIDPIGSMDWFHFHLHKKYAVMIDQISDPEASVLAIKKQLARLMHLDFTYKKSRF